MHALLGSLALASAHCRGKPTTVATAKHSNCTIV